MKSEIANNRFALVNYFIKKEGYKPHKTKNNDEVSYLYNNNAKIKVIRIKSSSGDDDFLNDTIVDKLVTDLKEAARARAEVIWIYLDDTNSMSEKNTNSNIKIVGNEKNLISQLKPYFPKIETLKFESDNTKDEIVVDLKDQEQVKKFIEDLDDSNSNVSKKFKEFHSKIQSGQLIGTWINLALFSFLPVLLFFYITFWASGAVSYGGDSVKLFLGGTNYNLTILGGQFWRVLTYGVAIEMSPNGLFIILIFLVVNFVILRKLSAFAENTIGFIKTMLIVFISYVIAGLVLSVMLPGKVSGGPLIISAILIGAIFIKTLGKSDVISILVKRSIIMPLVILLISPILFANDSLYWEISAGFMIGCGVTIIFNASYKGMSLELATGYLMTFGFLATPLIMLLVPAFTPAYHNATINALAMYIQSGFIKLGMANSIFDKIGWDLAFVLDGNVLVLM
ncbi:putative rhomboid-like transmembrane protein [Spiroplasma sabaudiense Ar-1343]|uniref:Putative rhomboid-like transmembrane protein n=1 Tax=Spiroplasma sabaudiense Ar-1343 TaxID=1276257 RepID=W6AAG1_9MOLU|nr:hypothetical protein [Spiroplasma sabaudiense]AHI53996.1 putative rhomboid-like transmembrane protein [Spiroplasma sabaudiense Ar-1343]